MSVVKSNLYTVRIFKRQPLIFMSTGVLVQI
jgi:hypothetical protein